MAVADTSMEMTGAGSWPRTSWQPEAWQPEARLPDSGLPDSGAAAPGAAAPGATRRARRRMERHAHKDARMRQAQRRGKARKQTTSGRLTEAALERAGARDAPGGALSLEAWLPAIPLDVYQAVLASAPAGGPARARLRCVPGQLIEERWQEGEGRHSRVRLTFRARSGGTCLHLVHEGIPSHRVQERAERWRRFLLAPRAHGAGG